MAIQLTRTSPNLFVCTYFRIDHFEIDATLTVAKAKIGWYENKTAARAPVWLSNFETTLDGGNTDPREEVYNQLKMLPEWAGATDV